MDTSAEAIVDADETISVLREVSDTGGPDLV